MIVEIELILKLVIAALLGSVIGIEREWHEKPAGLRTHTLVCIGAAIFAIVASSIGGADTDIARVSAAVVTGIGFLGAGAIFREQEKVKGLTTAADLWVLAGIGLAVGIGYYAFALISTYIVLLILIIGRVIDSTVEKRKAEKLLLKK